MSKCRKTIHRPQAGFGKSLHCQVIRERKVGRFKAATCSYLTIKIFFPVVQRKIYKVDIKAHKD